MRKIGKHTWLHIVIATHMWSTHIYEMITSQKICMNNALRIPKVTVWQKLHAYT